MDGTAFKKMVTEAMNARPGEPLSIEEAKRRLIEKASEVDFLQVIRENKTAAIGAALAIGIILGASPNARKVGSSRVDLQACKLEYSIVSPK